MSTDRELLELAAKSYWGHEIDDVCSIEWDEADGAIAYTHADNQDHNGCDQKFLWNPLTDDGDEARLEAKLGIDIEWFGSYVIARCGVAEHTEDYKGHADEQAARRRAGVMVAAELGRKS